jgi:hypothetical protein
MSTSELPDDLASWPHDPYRLLGVRPGVDRRALRRAYLALIHRYKPEHAPEHFQRIRAAYEAIEQHIAWTGGGESEPDRAGPDWPDARNAQSDRIDSRLQADALWENACQGETRRAYRGLVELAQAGTHAEKVHLQLHWLHLAEPALDPARPACDWLIRGLQATGHSWVLREALRRVADTEPELALGESYARLLAPGGSPGLILFAASLRWRAARLFERPRAILDDVEVLRSWLREADETSWLRLLINAATQVAWCEGTEHEAVKRLCREAEQGSPRHLDLSDELVELDLVQELTADWRLLGLELGSSSALYRLLPLTWDEPRSESFPLVQAYLDEAVRSPLEGLRLFDFLGSRAPRVLGHMSSLLERMHDERPERRQQPARVELMILLLPWLAGQTWWNYAWFRPRLLEFCVREAIVPEELARAMADRGELAITRDQHLAHAVSTDWALHGAYRATALALVWPFAT